MPAGERLGDRAGVHPCTAHRPLSADPWVLTVAGCSCTTFPNRIVQLGRQVILWFRMKGTLTTLCSEASKALTRWDPNHLNLSRHWGSVGSEPSRSLPLCVLCSTSRFYCV